jgi:cytochrome c oxidase subunit I
MHYLGFLGMPRRYYAMGSTDFIPESAQSLNASITISALIVGLSQLIFLYNVFWSLRNGKPAGHNPWGATSLEWQTPDTRPPRQLGPEAAGGVPLGLRLQRAGREQDFIPQNHPVSASEQTADEHGRYKS